MKLTPDHLMSFEIINKADRDETVLPTIENPAYVYTKGDTFYVLTDIMAKGASRQKYTVTDVEHEILEYVDVGEQHIIVYVESIKDESIKTDKLN